MSVLCSNSLTAILEQYAGAGAFFVRHRSNGPTDMGVPTHRCVFLYAAHLRSWAAAIPVQGTPPITASKHSVSSRCYRPGCHATLVTPMDISNMLAELRSETHRLEEAILALQRLAGGSGGKRRGRPPKWMAATTDQAVSARSTAPQGKGKRKPFSAATRKKMAAAQRKRWAARKAQAA